MAKTFTIEIGAQVPGGVDATEDLFARIGGGVITAIEFPAGLAGTTYDCEWSPDEGTTWLPVYDESNTARQLTLNATGGIVQINPGIVAPSFRLNGDTNETADSQFKCHTV